MVAGRGQPGTGPRTQLWIAAVCVLVYFFTNGMSLFVPQNLFPRFMETFGATPAEVSRTTAITFGIAGLLAPFVGAAIDRFGVVRVIRTGLLVLGITFIAYPAARSLQDLYLLHAVIAVGLILSGLMPNVVLLSRWFSARRGTAVGVLVAGSSLAGATLPVAISPLVNDPALGWRVGMGVLAAAFWLLAVLPAFLVLRDTPAPEGAGTGPAPPVDGVTFAVALRSRTLWCLAIGSACLWFAIQAMTSQITIYFEQEAGLAPQRATALYSTILACSVAGKFLFGAVSDRFRKQRVMVVTSLTLLAGCLLLFTAGDGGLALAGNPAQLAAFAVIFGLGFGGSFTLIQLVAVESFGQLALGRILGVVTFVDTMGGAAGTLLAGQIRTATGDYFVTFTVVVIVAVIALANVLLIRPLSHDQGHDQARITNA
ncbi:MAG: MFS transporter [Chromatiales bacterium]|nr:MFS transporter [Chromatiales bacterium]